jgi:chitin-binding protein
VQPHFRVAAAAGAALLVAAALRSMGPVPAQGQDAMFLPGSRTYLCYVDGHQPGGDIRPANPACRNAMRVNGTQAFYDWFGVMRPDGQGRTRGFIPDGALCSAGLAKYAGFDAPRDDWPVTHLSEGANTRIEHGNRVAHPGWFSLYVTRDGYRASRPLTWNDMESQPFYSAAAPPGAILPRKTGRHVIYSVWTRENSHETFYGCVDVVFDGGGGEVTGIRSSQANSKPGPGGEG